MAKPALLRDLLLLGAYLLPGRASDPRLGVEQALAAERLGLGTVWISERLGVKDLGTLGGAVAQATREVCIAAGAGHLQSRHPLALASLGITLQALSGGRFKLGFGRSVPQVWQAQGLPPASHQLLIDGAQILRKLWARETVSYSGPLGRFPALRFTDLPDVAPPPLLLTAIGPRTLALAGSHFDGVILHPFLTLEGVARSTEIVREAARAAGRDPESVRIYGCVVTAADLSPAETDLRVRARATTYFQVPFLAKWIVWANGWDAKVLERVQEHSLVAALGRGGLADGALAPQQLVEVSRVLPEEWFETGAAVGSAARCAQVLRDHLAAGADELIVHGSTPELLEPLLAAFAS